MCVCVGGEGEGEGGQERYLHVQHTKHEVLRKWNHDFDW